MGMASVIHQVAINAVTAAQYIACCDMPFGNGNKQITINNRGPKNKPNCFALSNITISLMRFLGIDAPLTISDVDSFKKRICVEGPPLL